LDSSAGQRQSSAAFLAGVEILSVFTPDELAAAVKVRSYAFGDAICSAGGTADGLYVIKSGSVRVFSEEHGKETSMGVRKAGEVFAEIAILRRTGMRCRRAPRSRPSCGASRAAHSRRSSNAIRKRSASSTTPWRSARPAA
jgi:CRP-like cAMP-binding protein